MVALGLLIVQPIGLAALGYVSRRPPKQPAETPEAPQP
jgi:hypothetical protein